MFHKKFMKVDLAIRSINIIRSNLRPILYPIILSILQLRVLMQEVIERMGENKLNEGSLLNLNRFRQGSIYHFQQLMKLVNSTIN